MLNKQTTIQPSLIHGGYQIDVEIPKCPVFGHVLVTDAKMPHFKGRKEILGM